MTDGAGDVVDNALADEQTLTALREQNEELRRRLAAADEYRQEAERLQAKIKPLHREETRDGSWELLDYGSIVVHVFQPETREFYRLEALWNDAPVMDLVAEAGITDAVYSDRIAELLGERAAELEENRQEAEEE